MNIVAKLDIMDPESGLSQILIGFCSKPGKCANTRSKLPSNLECSGQNTKKRTCCCVGPDFFFPVCFASKGNYISCIYTKALAGGEPIDMLLWVAFSFDPSFGLTLSYE
jgi:hypothetical protein